MDIIDNIKDEENEFFFKGLRYYLGVSLPNTKVYGFNAGLFGNWECGICKPNKENKIRLQELFEQTKKSKEEIINIGKLETSHIIEEISTKSKIPINILTRFTLNKITSIGSITDFNKIKNNEKDISAKSKSVILKIYGIVRDLEPADPRIILKYINSLISKKEFVDKISKYNEAIDIQLKENKFEEEFYNAIKNIGEFTLKNVIISNKEFTYITEIDVCSRIDNKTILFLCKDTNYRNLVNKKWQLIKKVQNINKYIKPDCIVIVTSCNMINKNIFLDRNIRIIDKDDLNRIRDNNEGLNKILFKNNKSNINNDTFKQFLDDSKLSKKQLLELLNIGEKRLKEDNIKAKEKLKILIGKNLDNIELHKMANFGRINEDNFILKYVRNKLGIKIKDLELILKENKENLSNVERGLLKNKRISNKLELFLRKNKKYNKLRNEAIKEYKNLKSLIILEDFRNLIGIRSQPRLGRKLENKIHNFLINKSFQVIRNAVISDKNVTFKKEADLYAVINKKQLVIECSESRIDTKLQDLAALFQDYKNIGIEKVAYINPHITAKAREILNINGIIALKPSEIGEILNE